MSISYQPEVPDAPVYTSLTNLLSEGFPEDTKVSVWATSTAEKSMTIAALRAQYQDGAPAKLHRVVAVANEGFAEHAPAGGYQYAVALITEDAPGWSPGRWYRYLHEAQQAAREFNRIAGHSQDTVLEVQVSSMRAGRVR